jgi:hypothetical protein
LHDSIVKEQALTFEVHPPSPCFRLHFVSARRDGASLNKKTIRRWPSPVGQKETVRDTHWSLEFGTYASTSYAMLMSLNISISHLMRRILNDDV